MAAASIRFPLHYQRLVGVKVSQRFREAAEIRSASITQADIGSRDLLIRNRFVGVNASDINMTAGVCARVCVCVRACVCQCVCTCMIVCLSAFIDHY